MYSVNVPVPGGVSRVAAGLEPRLTPFDRVRDRHTLVVKRFADDVAPDVHALRERLRAALRGAPAFEARVSRVARFEEPPAGPAPVVYLAVESPGLLDLHDRLVDAFGRVDGLEGPDYVPHVTLARGGDRAAAAALTGPLADHGLDPVAWTVSALELWDATHRETVARLPLPA